MKENFKKISLFVLAVSLVAEVAAGPSGTPVAHPAPVVVGTPAKPAQAPGAVTPGVPAKAAAPKSSGNWLTNFFSHS